MHIEHIPYLSKAKYLDKPIDLLERRLTNESQNNYVFMCIQRPVDSIELHLNLL